MFGGQGIRDVDYGAGRGEGGELRVGAVADVGYAVAFFEEGGEGGDDGAGGFLAGDEREGGFVQAGAEVPS